MGSNVRQLFGRTRYYALEKADRIDGVSHAAKLVAIHIADQCMNDTYTEQTHDPFQLAAFAMVEVDDLDDIMNELIRDDNDLIMSFHWVDSPSGRPLLAVLCDSFNRKT